MDAVFREEALSLSGDNGQVRMSDAKVLSPTVQRLARLYSTNCARCAETLASRLLAKRDFNELGSAADAALTFMISATPDNDLSNDLLGHYDEYRESISSVFDTDVSRGNGRVVEMLHGVPDTVGPVKAHHAYVQVPNGDKTELTLVWKVHSSLYIFLDESRC